MKAFDPGGVTILNSNALIHPALKSRKTPCVAHEPLPLLSKAHRFHRSGLESWPFCLNCTGLIG